MSRNPAQKMTTLKQLREEFLRPRYGRSVLSQLLELPHTQVQPFFVFKKTSLLNLI